MRFAFVANSFSGQTKCLANAFCEFSKRVSLAHWEDWLRIVCHSQIAASVISVLSRVRASRVRTCVLTVWRWCANIALYTNVPVCDSKLVARPRPAYVYTAVQLYIYGTSYCPGHTYCNIAPPGPVLRMRSHTYTLIIFTRI